MTRRSPLIVSLVLVAMVAVCVGVRLWVVGGPPSDEVLAWRGWRALTAAIVGVNLGLAGVLLQCLLRNPLASPDLLGLASGSGFAVLAGMLLGILPATSTALSGGGNITFDLAFAGCAALGAWGALVLTYVLSRRRGTLDPTLLVLTGVAIGVACAAGMVILRYMLPYQQTGLVDRLLQGLLREDVPGWQLAAILGVTLTVVILMLWWGRDLDGASLSEDEALSMGVPLPRVRAFMFISAGLLTAGTIVLAGPIGFVGLIAPHMARKLVGPLHRSVTIPAALLGAAILLSADVIAGMIQLPAGRLPVSAVTAIIGVPAFVWVLRANVRQGHA
jgi:iron complex transport system permease protein